jgi:sortase A
MTGLVTARIERSLRWSGRLLFITGIVALGYVAFTLLDARLYQVSAKRSLENQIQLAKTQPGIRPSPMIKEGGMLGRLDIPRIGLSVAVLQGTSPRTLRLGAGHIAGSALPGMIGNSAIAGHRDTFFRALKDVREQDELQLLTPTGLSHYRVDWIKVIAPDDLSVLAASTQAEITLVTCYPFYFLGAAPNRFVVRAHRY